MELSKDLLKLTGREVQILKMTADGMTAKQIANHFSVSRRTIEVYREEILKKLGASCQAHAVAIGMRTGLIA